MRIDLSREEETRMLPSDSDELVSMNTFQKELVERVGYRVQHNNILGPFKGGIRFRDDIYLDEIKSSAGYAADECCTAESSAEDARRTVDNMLDEVRAVSYTHLTLPTKA